MGVRACERVEWFEEKVENGFCERDCMGGIIFLFLDARLQSRLSTMLMLPQSQSETVTDGAGESFDDQRDQCKQCM